MAFGRLYIAAALSICFLTFNTSGAQQVATAPLQLEAKIPLGKVNGRIDHLAVDLVRQRLFVAELGNNTVAIVDLKARSVLRRIEGVKEPQGLAYVAGTDSLYVASGGDGSVKRFHAADLTPGGQLDLGDDADNIRLDAAANQLIVGYGSGSLALIDLATFRKVADIPLSVHPEGFQLDESSDRIFVNLPRAKAISVADRKSRQQIATWPMQSAGGNFPMALTAEHVLVVFRQPAKLGVFSKRDGSVITSPDVCGDADDVFVNPKRDRVYVSCGEGFVDVLDTKGGAYRRIAGIPTAAGARTSLFVPELDRLMVAVRATSKEPAAIWLFRPGT
jgi:DNA-binding beta-propeller fold protein YncE